MKKESFYKIFIVLLLVLNLGIVGFLWTHRPGDDRPGPPHGPDRLIIERLKLDERQRDKFDMLKKAHHEQIVKIDAASGKLHEQLFNLLKNSPIDTIQRNDLLQALAEKDREKEAVTFQHFKDLRGILRPEQQPLFDGFVQELGQRLAAPGMPPPPGR